MALLREQRELQVAIEWNRFGRHYYDIYKLLEHKATLQKLKKDRGSFAALAAEVERPSARHFGGTTPRPEEGFAASPAFRHGREGELRIWLQSGYREVQALLPGTARLPSFGAVMRRVEEHGELL